MFIIYFNMVAIHAVFSRDVAEDYIRDNIIALEAFEEEFIVEYVDLAAAQGVKASTNP